MKKHVVYITGPMTGIKYFNYPAFYEAEKKLKKAGHKVINPARTGVLDTLYISEPTWFDFMISALKRMQHATAIYSLPGAGESFGGRIEAIVAERENLPEVTL